VPADPGAHHLRRLHGILHDRVVDPVTGTVTANPLSDVALTVMVGANAPVTVPVAPNGTWSVTVPLSAPLIFNGIRAERGRSRPGSRRVIASW
jgi:hypothetical protein